MLRARLELADRRPQAALDMLATCSNRSTCRCSSDAAAVRGQALFQLGRPVDAVRALVEREVWLERLRVDPRESTPDLGRAPSDIRRTAPLAPTGDQIVDGWLALAPIATSVRRTCAARCCAGAQTYTDHPAAGSAARRAARGAARDRIADAIALLLPSSSPQRSSGARDTRRFHGGASARRRSGAALRTRLRHGTGGSQAAYLRAQLDGADFIVGPLLEARGRSGHTQAGFVPTLALNFAQRRPFLRSFYQFALSPEDEARAIAADGGSAARRPRSRSSRATTAAAHDSRPFRTEFESRGGRLLDCAGYDRGSQEFSQPILSS